MPRSLTKKPNKMSLYDRLSDSDIELFYRFPTTKEQIDYDNSSSKRKRNKVTSTIGETRITYGERILTGIGDTSFTVEKDGKNVPLHSREDSDWYDPEWKALVKEMASDILSKFAFLVFEGSVEPSDGEDTEEGDDKGENPT